MTATITELTAVMGYLKPKDGEKKVLCITYGSYYFYVGKYGQHPVAVGMSAPGKGEQGPMSTIHYLYNIAPAVKQTKYIIAVGVCYGMDSKKKKPADIIVSDTVCDATCLRVGAEVKRRGTDYPAGVRLQNRFAQAIKFFKMTRGNNKNVEVEVGSIIARPDLVDDAKYKEQLISACSKPDALGGEMEGAAIMSFAHHNEEVQAIIIKAIGDWGDGNKKKMKVWKDFAAHAAAGYVHFVMERGIL